MFWPLLGEFWTGVTMLLPSQKRLTKVCAFSEYSFLGVTNYPDQ